MSATLLIISGIVLLLVLLPMALLWCFQNRLIYMPRPYPHALTTTLTAVPYRIAEGAQTAWLRRPSGPMHRVWVLFGGNAGLALEWSWLCEGWPRADDALLLIEYPGYGGNAGRPSRASIERSCDAAYRACAQMLQRSPEQLDLHLGLVGHSLGASIALQFCRRHAAQSLVLIAPFTSLRAMARARVGWALSWLLHGNLDNARRLRELALRTPPPQVLIVHGAADGIVPLVMGQALADLVPGTAFHAIEQADHVSVLDGAAGLMAAVVRQA